MTGTEILFSHELSFHCYGMLAVQPAAHERLVGCGNRSPHLMHGSSGGEDVVIIVI